MNKRLKTLLKILAALLLLALMAVGIVNTLRPGTVTLRKLRKWLGLSDRVPAEGVEIVFVSVGQGDCSLVLSEGFCALIDAGTADSLPDIEAVLEKEGVDRLDAVFVSHPHLDHIGALVPILRRYGADAVYFADIPDELLPATYTYSKLLDVIGDLRIPLRILKTGDTVEFPVGEKAGVFRVLHSGEGDDLNNASMVLKLEYGDTAALFMADAEFSAEQELLASGADLSADLLKVGHHGSRYSTSSYLLDACRPSFAVISCGAGNEYGYPTESAMRRLEDALCLVYRTDTMGSIIARLDGENCVMDIYGEETE